MTTQPYVPVTTGGWRKKPLDRSARRYFVYTLSGADGRPLYVGRSCNVAQRLRDHHYEAAHTNRSKAAWLPDVRGIDMVGPFTWDEAVTEERRQIRAKLPHGNRIGKPRGVAS